MTAQHLEHEPDSHQGPDAVAHVVGAMTEGPEAGGEQLQRPEHSLDLLRLVNGDGPAVPGLDRLAVDTGQARQASVQPYHRVLLGPQQEGEDDQEEDQAAHLGHVGHVVHTVHVHILQ